MTPTICTDDDWWAIARRAAVVAAAAGVVAALSAQLAALGELVAGLDRVGRARRGRLRRTRRLARRAERRLASLFELTAFVTVLVLERESPAEATVAPRPARPRAMA